MLDHLAARATSDPEGTSPDPVHLVRRYREPGDQEIAGLLAALLAYGQVETLCRLVDRVLRSLGPSPRRALREGRHRASGWGRGLAYRFQTVRDLQALLEGAATMIRDEGGLGIALAARGRTASSFDAALVDWAAGLRRRAEAFAGPSRGLRHLLPDPAGGSACKRWRLYLRWMVRSRGPHDLGTWNRFLSPADLILPLDTHWIRIGTRLGLTSLRTPGLRMAREITDGLRRIDPEDPLRFDYGVCHLGIRGGCPPRLTRAACRACELRSICAGAATRRGPAATIVP